MCREGGFKWVAVGGAEWSGGNSNLNLLVSCALANAKRIYSAREVA